LAAERAISLWRGVGDPRGPWLAQAGLTRRRARFSPIGGANLPPERGAGITRA
jgi:hypothetical protein